MKKLLAILTVATIFFACSKPNKGCFTFAPTTISPNQTVTFNASCSENASIFIWNFGDNSADTTTNALTITHKFSTTGQFAVTLTAKRKDGLVWNEKKVKPTTTQIVTVK